MVIIGFLAFHFSTIIAGYYTIAQYMETTIFGGMIGKGRAISILPRISVD
jgi:hypothetical protein